MISVFVPGLSDVDGFRSRYVTLSCPGDAYIVYESWPMSDQTKITFFIFVYKNSSLKCQNRMRCSRVLYLQEVSDLHS